MQRAFATRIIYVAFLAATTLAGAACSAKPMGERADVRLKPSRYTLMTFVPAGTDADGWRSLFDGRTTAGWRGFRQPAMPAGWQAVDGALTRVGQGGDIVTVNEFGDFELELEWNLSRNGNSGVFYRVTEDDDVMWHTAPEYQIIDSAYDKEPLKPVQLVGANYDLHPPRRDAARPVGSWNQTRLVVRGAHVEHWLNGVKVVEYELWSPEWEQRVRASKFKDYPNYARARRGRIGLQDHGDKVAFRNIRIRPKG